MLTKIKHSLPDRFLARCWTFPRKVWDLSHADDLQILDLCREKIQHTSAGESESKFIRAWDSEAKEGPLQTGSRIRVSCCCALFWWEQAPVGPLELRTEEAKYMPEKRRGGHAQRRDPWCPLSWGFYLCPTGRNFRGAPRGGPLQNIH